MCTPFPVEGRDHDSGELTGATSRTPNTGAEAVEGGVRLRKDFFGLYLKMEDT